MHESNRTGVRDPSVADHREPTGMFLPRGDSTIIDRIFASLEDDDRISEVVVSTNECFAQNFQDYLPATEFEKPTVSAFTVAA